MAQKLLAAIAGAMLAFIVFATLAPIGDRPHLGDTGVEHILAFAVVSLLLCAAYPGRSLVILVSLAIIAAGLEAAQFMTPDRHGRAIDLLQKLVGVLGGGAIAHLMRITFPRRVR